MVVDDVRFVIAFAIVTVACGRGSGTGSPSGSARNGTCIPFEPMPDYHTCLVSRPQASEPTAPAVAPMAPMAPADDSDGTRWANTKSGRRDKLRECLRIHSQGRCGWCAAHATVASLELVACTMGLADFHPSVPHLWYAGHGEKNFTAEDCRGGWFVEEAVKTARATTLIPDEAWEAHYSEDEAGNASGMNSTRGNVDWKCDPIFQTTASSSIAPSPAALRAALDRAGFPVISVPVYKGAGWSAADPHPGDIDVPASIPPKQCRCSCAGEAGCIECADHPHCVLGYHAVVLVDHDPVGQVFEFANSWDIEWGHGGYGTITDRAVASSAQTSFPIGAAVWPRPAACDTPVEDPKTDGGVRKACGRVTGDINADLWCLADDEITATGTSVPMSPQRWTFFAGANFADRNEPGILIRWSVDDPRVRTYRFADLPTAFGSWIDFKTNRQYIVSNMDSPARGTLEVTITKQIEAFRDRGTLAVKGSFRAHMVQLDGPGWLDVVASF